MELFKLFGTIAVNNSEANKALGETGDKAEKTQSILSKVAKGVGKSVLAVGKAAVVGIGAGVTALGGLTAKAVSAAGELEQNMGGSEAVFGKYAEKMQAKAKQAFSKMGLSTSDYLATANKMGSLFKGAGFDAEEAMTLSSDAMQRAADVASIMGISTEQAMESIAGAAKGNFTMMDNLGVAMNDTTLQAYALEKGIKKSTRSMTNQEKIGLAMEMFMEKTAYAAGNYTKENETLAGSLGTAKAAFDNFLSGSGSIDDFIATFSGAAKSIIGQITNLFPKLTSGLIKIVTDIVPMIPPMLAQLLPPLIEGSVGLINGLVAAMPQVVSALLDAAPALINGVMQVVNLLIAATPQFVTAIVNALPTLIPMLVDGMVSLIVALCAVMPQIIKPIIESIPLILSSVLSALKDNLPILMDGLTTLLGGLAEGIKAVIGWGKEHETVLTLIGIAIGTITAAIIAYNAAAGIKKALDMASTIAIYAMTAAETAHTTASTIATAATTAFGAAMSFLTSPITLVILAIGALIAIVYLCVKHWDKIKAAGAAAWEWIKNAWSKAGDFFAGVFAKIKNTFSKVTDAITKPFRTAIDKVKGLFSKLKLNFPKIKMPHFNVSPKGWKIGDLLKGKIPKLSVDWYAKAMDNGMILNDATIFGMNSSGQLLGAGEAGSETVVGTNSLLNMINGAVQAETGELSARMDRIINLLVMFFPQMLDRVGNDVVLDTGVLVGQLAPKMNVRLGEIQSRNARGG